MLTEWFRSNKLSLNIGKTKLLIISKRTSNNEIELSIDGHRLERVASFKFLGILVDEKLCWSDHKDYWRGKLANATHTMNKDRKTLPQSCLELLYYSLFYIHLFYGILLWGVAAKTSINKLINISEEGCSHDKLMRLPCTNGAYIWQFANYEIWRSL